MPTQLSEAFLLMFSLHSSAIFDIFNPERILRVLTRHCIASPTLFLLHFFCKKVIFKLFRTMEFCNHHFISYPPSYAFMLACAMKILHTLDHSHPAMPVDCLAALHSSHDATSVQILKSQQIDCRTKNPINIPKAWTYFARHGNGRRRTPCHCQG